MIVDCEDTGDEEFVCVPEDNDGETCESWSEGGGAIVLWPPNHKLHTITVADCEAIISGCVENPPESGGDGDGDGDGDIDEGQNPGNPGGPPDNDPPTGGDPGTDPDDGPVILAAPVSTDWQIVAMTADEAVDVKRGGDGHTNKYDMKILDSGTVEVRSERQGGGDGRVYRVELGDSAGNTAVCEIHVPHDQGPHGGAVDSGEQVRVAAE
jgi:hypothetical protein